MITDWFAQQRCVTKVILASFIDFNIFSIAQTRWRHIGVSPVTSSPSPAVQRVVIVLIGSRNEFTLLSVGRLVLGKLACQAGFVISFYDLSRSVAGPPFSVVMDVSSIGFSPPDGQLIDKTEGVEPAIAGWGSAGFADEGPHRMFYSEGLGGNDSQARWAV
ncbi:hypothetical protein MUBE_00710 [Mycobacterium uberis]|uniref:Uncharacterized protein n=1 Tax=Mycobacterium uberis TaxID=2162698 RepID=A0A3E1HLS4_9MYCO|nr:hypothetical protein MUBE_00710 [Mycobacterium uberis]